MFLGPTTGTHFRITAWRYVIRHLEWWRNSSDIWEEHNKNRIRAKDQFNDRECLPSFDQESLPFQFAVQKYKY